jgi:competence protein ComEC
MSPISCVKFAQNGLRVFSRRAVFIGFVSVLLFAVARAMPPAKTAKPLQICFIDVEGGQATLFVTPEGQSLLIDTGWPGNDGRDAERIVAAAKRAGIGKIDYVLITHFHNDHVGGAPQLAARIPVGTFIDHGENRESTDGPTVQGWQAYQGLLATGKYKRITPKPGDVLPMQGVEAKVVSSDGAVIDKSLPGAGAANASCATSEQRPGDQTENPRSLGVLLTFGKLKFLDLGDLTWDKEMELMCPVNKLGKIDVYIVSHHGFLQSGSPALVRGIAPRAAIMDNGAKKGGSRLASKIFGNCIFPRREAPRTMWLLNSSPIFRGPMPAIICSFRHGRTEASRYSTRERKQSSTAHLRTDPRLRLDPESAPYSLVEKHSQQCPPKEMPRQR